MEKSNKIGGLLKGKPVYGLLSKAKAVSLAETPAKHQENDINADLGKRDPEPSPGESAPIESRPEKAVPYGVLMKPSEEAAAAEGKEAQLERENKEMIEGVMQYERKTKAEKAFTLLKEKRIKSKVDQRVLMNYRDKVALFNKHLSDLPINFDIPRVGPG